MPPHSSHLLEPLGIGCFVVLKCSYGQMVEIKMWNGVNYINKFDFLAAYPFTWNEAYKTNTIKNSFGTAGLMPFCPDWVISKLNICLQTPTPPPSQGSNSSQNFTPKTPFTEKQLRWQALSIHTLLHARSQSPSPALNQLIKGLQLSMQSAILLTGEVRELQVENEKKKQKRDKAQKHMPLAEGLSVSEASALIAQPGEAMEAPLPPQPTGHSLPLQPCIQPPWWCGICRMPGHRRETCPDRPIR